MNETQLEHLYLKFGDLGPLNTDFPPLDQSVKGKMLVNVILCILHEHKIRSGFHYDFIFELFTVDNNHRNNDNFDCLSIS